MEKEEKYYCEGQGCKNEIPKPVICCNAFDCPCMGMPVEPPFCSEECYNNNLVEYTKSKGHKPVPITNNGFDNK